MPRTRAMLRCHVALLTVLVAAAPGIASAADTGDPGTTAYASLLRTINPQLQVGQSLAYARSVVADAERTHLDPRLIVALVAVESHWHPTAVSPVGAEGLGQLMPGTAATLRVNAWDPFQNIRGAATYLRAMLDHFAGRGAATMRFAIGAYNAGPAAVDRYHGIPPNHETQNYVRKVLSVWNTIDQRVGSAFANRPAPSPDSATWLANSDASALAVTPAYAASTDSGAAAGPAPAMVSAPAATDVDTP